MTVSITHSSTSSSSKRAGLVPRLRFPEFENGWETRTLHDIFGKITNGKANAQDHVDDGKYPLFDRSEEIKKSHEYIHDGQAVIIPGEGMRFQPRYFEGKFNLHQRAYALMKGAGSTLFFFYGLDFRKNVLSEKAVQSTVLSLRLPIIQKFTIPTPSLPEQQKIADCLSSLDDLIAAESEKLEALKLHKKGLMQELFPREGETVPRIRFPEFEGSGEWEVRRLGDLVRFQSGGTPSKSNASFWDGTIPWASAKDMKSFYLSDTIDHITDSAIQAGARLAPVGAILILTRGMTLLNDIPICLLTVPMSFNQDVKALHVEEGEGSTFLAFCLLGMKQVILDLVTVAGHGTGRLDTDQLKDIELLIPSQPERQKISSVLSSLDDRITAQSERIVTLKEHKKGLMQQLFPVMEG